MAANPKVSIITVVRNAPTALQYTVSAIRRLTYSEFEYLIVDGASTDDTVECIQANRDIITKWISEPDAGIYDAMNKALSLARGEYVWFLNAGDAPAAPDVLSRVFETADDAGFYYGDAQLLSSEGAFGKLVESPPDVTVDLMSTGMHVCHQAIIAKRALCSRYDPSYRFVADQKWVVELIKRAGGGHHVGMPLCLYRLGGVSETRYLAVVVEKLCYVYRERGLRRALWAAVVEVARGTRFYVGRLVRRGLHAH